MSIRRARTALVALVLLLAAVACSDDDGGGGSGAGGDFSVAGLIDELPASIAERGAMVTVGDLDAATELAGLERPQGIDDVDAVVEWLSDLTGLADDPVVHVPIADGLNATTIRSIDEIDAELGWTLVDVSTYAEVVALPSRFLVVTGDGIDGEVFADADVVELDGGVVTAGEGEELAVDPEGTTAARRLGTPLRMAVRDGRLVATSHASFAERWLTDEADPLGDVAGYAEVAAALDDAGVYGAVIVQIDTDGVEGGIEAPVDVAAVAWSVVDGEPVGHVVHHFASEDDAAAQVDVVEELFDADPALDGRFEEIEVVADGSVTIATVRFADSRAAVLYQMLMNRHPLFAG